MIDRFPNLQNHTKERRKLRYTHAVDDVKYVAKQVSDFYHTVARKKRKKIERIIYATNNKNYDEWFENIFMHDSSMPRSCGSNRFFLFVDLLKSFILLSIARISSDMLSRERVHQYLTEDFPPRYVVPQKRG